MWFDELVLLTWVVLGCLLMLCLLVLFWIGLRLGVIVLFLNFYLFVTLVLLVIWVCGLLCLIACEGLLVIYTWCWLWFIVWFGFVLWICVRLVDWFWFMFDLELLWFCGLIWCWLVGWWLLIFCCMCFGLVLGFCFVVLLLIVCLFALMRCCVCDCCWLFAWLIDRWLVVWFCWRVPGCLGVFVVLVLIYLT